MAMISCIFLFPNSCEERHQLEGRVDKIQLMIGMKLSTRASTLFLCVCSLKENAGKVYWQLFLSVVCPLGNHPINPYSAHVKMTDVV